MFPRLRSLVILLLLLVMAKTGMTQSCLVWEDETLSPNYNVDGLNVTVSISDTFNTADTFPNTGINAVGQQGGHTGFIFTEFNNNDINTNERITYTFTFGSPVKNLEFLVLDVDIGNFQDSVIVSYDGINATTGTFVTPQGAATVRDDEVFYEGWEGIVFVPPPSAEANLAFDSGTTYITSFSVSYFGGDDSPANPGYQIVGFGDVCWDTESDVSITKSDSANTYTPGSNDEYTITVTNAGPMDVSAVAITDVLPDGLTMNGNWTCATTDASCISGSPVGTNANGVGGANINQLVDLPVNSTIIFTVPVSYSSNPNIY